MKNTFKTKIPAIIASLCVLLSPLASASPAAAVTLTPVYDTDGTTILISTPEELAAIGTSDSFPRDGIYSLADDIDLSVYDNWTPLCGKASVSEGGAVTMVYNAETAFIGTLEGNGYTISGMNISGSNYSSAAVGLFSCAAAKVDGVNKTAYFNNIVFKDCHINVYAGVTVDAGILVGHTANEGGAVISNVSVIESTVKVFSGNKDNPSGVGSIAGQGIQAKLSNCYSDAQITAGCTSEGNTQFGVGGFVGRAWRGYVTAENCLFNGTIDMSQHMTSDINYCSGIFGLNPNNATYPTNLNYFINCYYNSDRLTVSDTTNGGSVDGTGMPEEELKKLYPEEIGLVAEYWCNFGDGPVTRATLDRTLDGFAGSIAMYDAYDLSLIGKNSDYPLDGSYILANDIDFSAYGSWTPIASTVKTSDNDIKAEAFTGVFNGGGHTLTGIEISVTGSVAYAGLFGAVSDAEICNLIIRDSTVRAVANDAGGNKRTYAGALAGIGYSDGFGKVENVAVYDTSVIAETYNSGNPSLSGGLFGILISEVDIKNCYVAADVSAKYTGSGESLQVAAGGLAGGAYNGKFNAEDSVFTGTLSTVYYGSDITEPTAAYDRRNSLLGGNSRGWSNSAYDNTGTASQKNCWYPDTVSTNPDNPRGLDGSSISYGEFKAAKPAELGLSSMYWDNYSNGPELKIIAGKAELPGFEGYTVISDADELAAIGVHSLYPLSGKYVLADDIDLSGYSSWTPIGGSSSFNENNAFSGIFDGNGHKITGMTVVSAENAARSQAAMFGSVSGAQIKNLVFENCTVQAAASNYVFAAVVAGYSDKAKTYFSNILIRDSSVTAQTGNADMESGIGSLVGGGSEVSVSNCYSDADITGICTDSGTGLFGAAGFIGYMWRGTAEADGCIFNGTIDMQIPDDTVFAYANGIMGLNKQQIVLGDGNSVIYDTEGNIVMDPLYPTNSAYFKNCYYNSDKLTVSDRTNGGAVDGTALTENQMSLYSTDRLQLDREYWVNTYAQPELVIGGGTRYTASDVNEDGKTDIKDMIRLKKYLSGISAPISLIAANLDGSDEVDAIDLAVMKQLMLIGSNKVTVDPSDTTNAVSYIGKTVSENNCVIMDWSYTGYKFSIIAEGNITADFAFSQTNPSFDYARVAVTVDGDEKNRKVLNISGERREYIIAEDLPSGLHTVEVVKLTERTKGTVYAYEFDFCGILLTDNTAEDMPAIDFYGDSITAGDGAVGNDRTNTGLLEGQDVTATYAVKTADLLGASARISAQSGIKTMNAASLFSEKWDYAANKTDLVVINLGTNDRDVVAGTNEDAAAAGITEEKAITDILTLARRNYPESPIVWVYGMMGNPIEDSIRPVVEAFAAKDGNVWYMTLPANTDGGGNHPNAQGHTVAAEALADFIKSNVTSSVF